MGNEVSSEQEAPAAPDPPPLTGTVPVCLLWPHGGKTAYICGSFTQWQKMPMQWRQAGASGEWFKGVDLTPGTHQYKFIIDGQWRHDHTAPTVLDNLGNVNNCTQVQLPAGGAGAGAGKAAEQPTGGRAGRPPDAEAEEDLGHDPRGRASGAASRTSLQSGVSGCSSNGGLGGWPSDPYLSTVRPRPESYGQVVPAREELLVHHTASLLLPPQLRLLLPQHHGDSTTMPLAVQMNHTFCSLRDDVSILAVAHRYKDRSVTQLLYKPGMVTIRARSHAAAAASAGVGGGAGAAATPVRRSSELRHISRDVQLQSVRVPGSQRDRDENGLEFTTYLVDSVLVVHGVQTTLRSARRYKHFQLLHQLLLKEFATLIPALPPKRAFGNLQSQFVEERRIALERYLQLCLSTPEVALSSTFCNFLEADVPGRDFSKLDDAGGVMGAACTKQGYLLKRGRRLASWKRRCFCLCASELFYYYTAEMSNPFQPLGVISLKPEPLDEPEPPSPPGGGADMRGATVSAVVDIGLPHLFGLTVHTKQRVWDLAADTAADRDEWIRVLCQAGAQLSTSGAEEPPALPRSAWAWAEMSKAVEEAAASKGSGGEEGVGEGGAGESGGGEGGEGGEAGEAGGASDEAVATLNGVLWKRASKVHIAQAAVAESGLARDWVTRHFRLLPSDGMLAYFQKQGDEASMVRGILPLASYDGVGELPAGADGSAGSTPDGLHAFQLTASDGSPERAFVLAATTAEEKLQWMERLRALFAAAAAARATAAAAAAAAPAVDGGTAPQAGSEE